MSRIMTHMPPQERVLLIAALPDDLLNVLRHTFAVDVMPPGTSQDSAALAESLAAADGVLVATELSFGAERLDTCPRLRVISKVGVGYDSIDIAAANARRILVCNTPGVLCGAVADLTFLLLLALTRRLRENEMHVRSGGWKTSPGFLGHDIRGKTLGVIGLGGTGRTVARTARGFDMDVIYYKRNRDLDAETSGLAAFRSRDDVFRQADVVSVHCPLTAETRRSIGEREFSLMKPTAYFVNLSRGGVVDQPALVRALAAKTITGAALDVMDPEPLDESDPLCSLPNVVLVPHIGSATVETRRAMHEMAVSNLLEAMKGGVPVAAVNRHAHPHIISARR